MSRDRNRRQRAAGSRQRPLWSSRRADDRGIFADRQTVWKGHKRRNHGATIALTAAVQHVGFRHCGSRRIKGYDHGEASEGQKIQQKWFPI